MTQAVEESLAEAVGVSNYNLDQTKRAANALAKRDVPLTSNQMEYSLLQRGIERSELIGGVEAIRRDGLPKLFAGYDQVWHW